LAKALGIGGIFFKCRDRSSLGAWYQRYLQLPVNERGGVEFDLGGLPSSAYCVWGPFDEKTHYFNPSLKEFMINLIVDDLDGALSQVEEGGATLVGGIEEYDYGRFGWFIDPEGNKVELWEPAP